MSPTGARRSVDVRTRDRRPTDVVDPAEFWAGTWAEASARNGPQAAADAELLGLEALTIRVDGDAWTMELGPGGIEARPGTHAALLVDLDREAFTHLVREERTALGLVIAGRVAGEGPAHEAFCAWDPVLRSLLDGRALHRLDSVAVQGTDGTALDLEQRFVLGERAEEAAHFLAEAGFLLLQGVFTDAEMDAVDTDLAAAVEEARPDDGASWWAATSTGERYPCRILDLVGRSPHLPRPARRSPLPGHRRDPGRRPRAG